MPTFGALPAAAKVNLRLNTTRDDKTEHPIGVAQLAPPQQHVRLDENGGLAPGEAQLPGEVVHLVVRLLDPHLARQYATHLRSVDAVAFRRVLQQWWQCLPFVAQRRLRFS